MSKDDIVMALRLTAMGRANHPLQEELAEKLAGLFENACSPVVCRNADELAAAIGVDDVRYPSSSEDLGSVIAAASAEVPRPGPKRGPGRPKKAE